MYIKLRKCVVWFLGLIELLWSRWAAILSVHVMLLAPAQTGVSAGHRLVKWLPNGETVSVKILISVKWGWWYIIFFSVTQNIKIICMIILFFSSCGFLNIFVIWCFFHTFVASLVPSQLSATILKALQHFANTPVTLQHYRVRHKVVLTGRWPPCDHFDRQLAAAVALKTLRPK